jgi:cell division protein FtsI (penicillin-binding protein 3)
VGAIKIALRMGDERMYKYIRAFGFGQQTGIELPGETRGMTKPLSRWSKVSIGAIAMGQEIGISAVQLATMISSIANDGMMLAPRIVAGETQSQGAPQTIAFHPVNERRVVSTKTAAEMRQMMQGVVLHGTGRKAALEGYSAAGKTGTAQKFDPATHKYSHTNFYASFAGFAPINNPAITIVVIFDSPIAPTITQREGGWQAAPVFNRIAQQVLEYMHTPHDLELPASRQTLLASAKTQDKELGEGSPDHPGEALDEADAATADALPSGEGASAHAAPPVRPGEGDHPPPVDMGVTPASMRERVPVPATPVAVAQSGEAPAEQKDPSPTSGTVVLDVEQGGIVVPSFTGQSVRAAIEAAEADGLDLDIVGDGVAQDQSPPAGSHVSSGSRVTVRFAR